MTLPAADTLAALRGRLAALEAARLAFAPAQATDPGPLACCGAGALPGALHEVAAKSECETPAAAGFVLPLAAAAARGRVTLWIAEDMALAENGALVRAGAGGFRACARAPAARRGGAERDVLWAMEEACAAAPSAPSSAKSATAASTLTASRRLSLAAATGGRGGVPAARAAGRRAGGGGDALDRARRAVGAAHAIWAGAAALARQSHAQPAGQPGIVDFGVEQCRAAYRARNGSLSLWLSAAVDRPHRAAAVA